MLFDPRELEKSFQDVLDVVEAKRESCGLEQLYELHELHELKLGVKKVRTEIRRKRTLEAKKAVEQEEVRLREIEEMRAQGEEMGGQGRKEKQKPRVK